MAFLFRGYRTSRVSSLLSSPLEWSSWVSTNGGQRGLHAPQTHSGERLGLERRLFPSRLAVRLLQRWTLPTQMATASVTAGTGDLIWQKGFEKKEWSEVEVRALP